MSVQSGLEELKSLRDSLMEAENQLELLDGLPLVKNFFSHAPKVAAKISKMPPAEAYLLMLPIALGQGERLYGSGEEWESCQGKRAELLSLLEDLERIYRPIGGVVGYQFTLLSLAASGEEALEGKLWYEHPPLIDISGEGPFRNGLLKAGLEALPLMGEIYPIGGAGDRLNLFDEEGVEPLPAAMLPFCGRSLLELLVRDLQAREYLYYKLYGKQLALPVAMMTSLEKNNAAHIAQILEVNNWFGRSAGDYFSFLQPLVPMVTSEGGWVIKGLFDLQVKPGGHGVLWRCAIESGAFDWFAKKGCSKALVRQINNPAAGTDGALLLFAGIGCREGKAFGFASCPRRVGSAEGMNVLRIAGDKKGYHYAVTNIEYTDFKKRGIEDCPAAPGTPYSRFPSNTNILFVDLEAVKKASERLPLPGLIVNMKGRVQVEGRELPAGRLETTMQNVADAIVDTFAEKRDPVPPLQSYVTENVRSKTLSTAKKAYLPGAPLLETPQGCYFELLQNHRELFNGRCGMALPPMGSEEEYLRSGPPFHLLFHPALGPAWEIIAQKVKGGSMAYGAELQLEIAELFLDRLELDGSLLIEALSPLGTKDREGHIAYGNGGGKCWLERVKVKNKGVIREEALWWKNSCPRREALHIVIHGDGEFIARDMTFVGDERIEVAAGTRVTAYDAGEGIVSFKKEELSAPSWYWRYSYGADEGIVLS